MKKLDKSYVDLLGQIKEKIQGARTRACLAINREMILLYWEIGKMIALKQEQEGWGKAIVERLSKDLEEEFPGSKSFSARNLWFMMRFYEAYKNSSIVKQLVSQIPWGHNITIMQKIKSAKQREYYLRTCIEQGWSRSVLVHQIQSGLYERDLSEGKQHNFGETLPAHIAEQAQNALKSEYNLEFLGIEKEVRERELESKMLEKIRDVLIELGRGFAFLGSQYKLVLGQKEYFVDLLFYHRYLQCLVAVDLKVVEFEPEFAGKMNFYLNVLDEKEKLPHENPTIGMILCQGKDRTTVEFALKGISKPLGVADYYLTKKLPRELQGKLPTARELEKKLQEKKSLPPIPPQPVSLKFSVDSSLNKRQHQFLSTELYGASITSSQYAEQMGVSPSTALRDLKDLVKKGYLIKKGKGRGTHFAVGGGDIRR